MWRKKEEKRKGNHSWPPTGWPIATGPTPQKKSHSSAFIPDIICYGISLLASLCQVCRLCSFQAFCPVKEGRAGERRPWHCPCTARQSPELLCYQHFQSHPNLGCSEGSYSIPARLCMLPNVYESTKANFYILTLENSLTNYKTEKVKSGYDVTSRVLLMRKMGISCVPWQQKTDIWTAEIAKY